MDTIEMAIPAMLGEPWADASAVTFDEGWDATDALLVWIIDAAAAAGQPDPLTVIAGASASYDPAAPSADRIHPSSDAHLDDAEAHAYVTIVMVCAAVMGAYLQGRSVFDFVAGDASDLTCVSTLQDGEELTARSLRALVCMCSSAASEHIAASSASVLSAVFPPEPAVSSGFAFEVGSQRLLGAIHLWHEMQAAAAAKALSVDRDHPGVYRMVMVAEKPLDGPAQIDDLDEDWNVEGQGPDISIPWGVDSRCDRCVLG